MGTFNEQSWTAAFLSDIDQPLDLYTTRSAYDVIPIWAKVVNESLATAQPCDTAFVIGHFVNRTFDVPTGRIYVSPDGTRFVDQDIYVFDNNTGLMKVRVLMKTRTSLIWNTMQLIGLFNAVQNLVTFLGLFKNTVFDDPPLDVPECGYSDPDCTASIHARSMRSYLKCRWFCFYRTNGSVCDSSTRDFSTTDLDSGLYNKVNLRLWFYRVMTRNPQDEVQIFPVEKQMVGRGFQSSSSCIEVEVWNESIVLTTPVDTGALFLWFQSQYDR